MNRPRSALLQLLLAIALLAAGPAPAGEDLWNKLHAGGYVLLIRHAATDPGVGDPPGFKLGDCATQRNLSAAGRAQARQLGGTLKKRGIPVAATRSSRWCRCLETAQLAFGKAQPWPLLDNTFETPQRREPQMRQIRAALAQPVTGGNLVLVTHGVNILALTGISPAESEIVIVRPAGNGKLQLIGRLTSDS